jgi:hypothetical protein
MTYYYEKRTLHKPIATLGGDIARHLQLRQHLGKSVVICESPMATLSATRKQWMRISRLIQTRRASTLNAEEILRYTRSITHMQHMRFVAKTPEIDSSAHVFFVTPDEFETLPLECQTVYFTATPRPKSLEILLQLPESSLVVEYGDLKFTLPGTPQPKERLEKEALIHWEALLTFLKERDISLQKLSEDNPFHSRALDDALDTLLGISSSFLGLAFNFQHALTLAQPLATIGAERQRSFDIVLRLAHRVHSLTPNVLSHYIAGTDIGNKDSYFLRDRTAEINEIFDYQAATSDTYLPETATIEE